ncbi:MAG TPA: zinc-dependent metalloprotease family protein [Flavobacterium sp.]|nr:zinc-dependent metalloprotease family protein [Flavobacterium sp.]
MKKTLLLIVFSIFAINFGYAQTEKAWGAATSNNVNASKDAQRQSFPSVFTLMQSNPQLIREALANAPQRLSAKKSGTIITMPNAAGGTERFEVFEASNFEPALQAQFPEIRSYAGTGVDDKLATIRMSIDPSGIQAMVFRTDKRNEFIEPYSADGKVYAIYNSDRQKGKLPFVCSTDDKMIAQTAERTAAARLSNSSELLTFRLALSCNGEYTAYFGGTIPGALAAFNATMTRVNGVFEKDFSIHMNIIANTTSVIYTNAATDPYTNLNSWNGQLQAALTATIGEANYDIGHMFGATGGGGNAGCIGCVCVDGQKGSGITSPADGVPMGDNFDIDYVAHEMGHQFGGNHTFSNSVEGSGVNVEPGSGSTIMGYAGITPQDIQAHSDDYFVYASIKQVQDNMVGKTCPVRTPLSNVAPVMDAGKDYTIPKSTPFVITGSGTDGNGDPLTYCWEENDSATTQTGTNSQASATKTGGPNWRSYDPVSTPTRYFPPLARVVANQLTTTFLDGAVTIKTEAVSSVARTLNFTLTGRDNVAGIGQTGTDAMVVTVAALAGPFLVSSPNTAVSWEAESNQTVTWDVAGTVANNINAAYVDIYLSNDGGLTYPTLLASKVPNDGSETVTIPNTVGTTNRIMVKGWDHIFYDISNVNFTITAAPSTFGVSFLRNSGEQNKPACTGADMSYTLAYEASNGFAGTTTFAVTGQPAGATVTFSPTSVNASGNITMTISNTAALTPGFYSMTVTATSGAIVRTVPYYFQLFSSNFVNTTLVAPTNSAVTQDTSLSLTWAADANASSYDVQLATDDTFTNIIRSATVSTTSFYVTGLLEATSYYWRVLPKNLSCAGVFSTSSTFQTGMVLCDSYASTNVPLAIAATGAPTINSTIVIPAGSATTISDLNVSVTLNHTWISDLTGTLISPSGTQVQLFANPCGDEINDIAATFDDSGAAVVCGDAPGISGTVKSLGLLSAFNGQSSAGTWTLRIADGFNQDGGALTAWSLNICHTAALATVENHLSNFVIYPNPNNGSFNVQFTPNSGNDVKINVHDIRGREIFSKSYNNNGLFNENLQLNNVQAGMYLVTVQNGNQKEVKKIVIE